MRKKIIIGTIAIGLILATLGICFVKNITEKSALPKQDNNPLIKVVNVDEVINAPESYKGFLAVQGTAINIEGYKDIFLLGCEDACKFMPVKYKGQMPKAKSEIIVYGQIRKRDDDRYIFQAKKVKTK